MFVSYLLRTQSKPYLRCFIKITPLLYASDSFYEKKINNILYTTAVTSLLSYIRIKTAKNVYLQVYADDTDLNQTHQAKLSRWMKMEMIFLIGVVYSKDYWILYPPVEKVLKRIWKETSHRNVPNLTGSNQKR